MTADKHAEMTRIFLLARKLKAVERAEMLARECQGQEELRCQIEQMLANEADASECFNTEARAAVVSTFEKFEEIPETIDSWRIVRLLGQGGMGVVYLAEKTDASRSRVAIKLVNATFSTAESIARFKTEQQLLELMNHPAIARVHQAGITDQGRPYFPMEYIEGVPITQYCDAHSLPLSDRIVLFEQVCNGIKHAHQKGIIHRDITASNVLVTLLDGKPVPKIIDFGVAKVTDDQFVSPNVQTEIWQQIGTPEYMSPEQMATDSNDIDTRSDVYSLGVLFYELITGVRPLMADKTAPPGSFAFRTRVREEDPPKPSSRFSSMSPSDRTSVATKRGMTQNAYAQRLRGDLDWITMTALSKDRGRRYATVSEFAADLIRYLKYQPILAGPPGHLYSFRKFVARHKIGFLSSTAILAAISIGAILATVGLIRATRAEIDARQAYADAIHESMVAEEVVEFLIDLFKVSDPNLPGNDSITVRDLLDRGASNIELVADPKIRSRLLDTIGVVHINLGNYTHATRYLNDAVRLERDPLTGDQLQLARRLSHLADAEGRLNEFEQAYQRYSEALAIQQVNFDGDHLDIAETLEDLGWLHDLKGDFAQAENFHRRALNMQRRIGAVDAETVNNLGVALYRRHNLAEAESLYREARQLLIEQQGMVDTVTFASIENNLGTVLRARGDYESAIEQTGRAVEIMNRLNLGNDHSDAAAFMQNLAAMLAETGELEKAQTLLKSALSIQKKILGESHPNVAIIQSNLAGVALLRGEYSQATIAYEEAWNLLLLAFGKDHVNVATVQVAFADALNKSGKYSRAFNLAISGRDAFSKLAPTHWFIAYANSVAGSSLSGLGRFQEAEQVLISAYVVLKESPEAGELKITSARERILRLYQDWGREEDVIHYRNQFAQE